MYEIRTSGEKFDSFTRAIAAAKALGAEVFEVATGLRRWAPAPPVSKARVRQYRERLAAYAAQEATK